MSNLNVMTLSSPFGTRLEINKARFEPRSLFGHRNHIDHLNVDSICMRFAELQDQILATAECLNQFWQVGLKLLVREDLLVGVWDHDRSERVPYPNGILVARTFIQLSNQTISDPSMIHFGLAIPKRETFRTHSATDTSQIRNGIEARQLSHKVVDRRVVHFEDVEGMRGAFNQECVMLLPIFNRTQPSERLQSPLRVTEVDQMIEPSCRIIEEMGMSFRLVEKLLQTKLFGDMLEDKGLQR